jgi:hypothetical protein
VAELTRIRLERQEWWQCSAGLEGSVSFEIFGQFDGLSILYRAVRVDENLGFFFFF